MTAISDLVRHLVPEMTGGFIGFWLHSAHHKVFEAVHKRLPKRRPQP